MFDYLRYYFSPALQVMAAVGIYIGGPYCWLGLATLPGLAIIDTVLPRDTKERKINNRALADIPIWIGAIFAVGLYLFWLGVLVRAI